MQFIKELLYTNKQRRISMTNVPAITIVPPVSSNRMTLVPVRPNALIYSRWFVVARTTHFRVCDTFNYIWEKKNLFIALTVFTSTFFPVLNPG